MGILTIAAKPVPILIAVAFILVGIRFHFAPDTLSMMRSETLHEYNLTMSYEAISSDISIETYLPIEDERQEIIRERINSGSLQFDESIGEDGRKGAWRGDDVRDIQYSALIANQAAVYSLDESLRIPSSYPEQLQPFLREDDGIQVNHPEIAAAWAAIQPDYTDQLNTTLRAIYDFVYNELDSAPFKGYTDALTALRLGQASCNGKGRLFVAFARLNDLPARLVGGIVLNNGSKRVSHQWVEVYVQDRWVPFDPTNGHFATLPFNYLRLYTGDEALFRHTSNINFDYRFDIRKTELSSALFRFPDTADNVSSINVAQLLTLTGLTEKTVGVFLMFPFATLVIVFLRNIVGLKTFGIFMPMLVAAACVETGLPLGLGTFMGIVLFAYGGQVWLDRFNLLKIPRLGAIITLCTVLFIAILWGLGERSSIEFGMLALFPVVIISFLAERIHTMAADRDWWGVIVSGTGALVGVTLCYLAFASVTLQGLFALMPELLLIVLALQIAVGQWSGMRLLEYVRFRRILGNGDVLGINRRNRNFIQPLNGRELLELATDKIETKKVLAAAKVPVAKNLGVCAHFQDLDEFIDTLEQLDEFALKPNRGSQGNGILIIARREGDNFYSPSGKAYSLSQIRQHTSDILSGSFSQDGSDDTAYIEPLLTQHHALSELANLGLADIRVILHRGQLVTAMLRVPTSKSNGKANLHQGAVGLAIDVQRGVTTHAALNGKKISQHPDTGANLIGYTVPFWSQMKRISVATNRSIPLGFIGVDLCIDETLGPLVLEVNGRPGIEIQNVQEQGLFSGMVSEVQRA